MDEIDVIAPFTTTTQRFAAGDKLPADALTADQREALTAAGYLKPDKPAPRAARDLPAVAPADPVAG